MLAKATTLFFENRKQSKKETKHFKFTIFNHFQIKISFPY